MPTPIDFETRCLQIWQVLISSASNRQTIFYDKITEAIGWGALGFTLGPYLNCIATLCELRRLPNITVIVVAMGTGRPSTYTGQDLDKDREAAFAANWFAQLPPTREEFANARP